MTCSLLQAGRLSQHCLCRYTGPVCSQRHRRPRFWHRFVCVAADAWPAGKPPLSMPVGTVPLAAAAANMAARHPTGAAACRLLKHGLCSQMSQACWRMASCCGWSASAMPPSPSQDSWDCSPASCRCCSARQASCCMRDACWCCVTGARRLAVCLLHGGSLHRILDPANGRPVCPSLASILVGGSRSPAGRSQSCT